MATELLANFISNYYILICYTQPNKLLKSIANGHSDNYPRSFLAGTMSCEELGVFKSF